MAHSLTIKLLAWGVIAMVASEILYAIVYPDVPPQFGLYGYAIIFFVLLAVFLAAKGLATKGGTASRTTKKMGQNRAQNRADTQALVD